MDLASLESGGQKVTLVTQMNHNDGKNFGSRVEEKWSFGNISKVFQVSQGSGLYN